MQRLSIECPSSWKLKQEEGQSIAHGTLMKTIKSLATMLDNATDYVKGEHAVCTVNAEYAARLYSSISTFKKIIKELPEKLQYYAECDYTAINEYLLGITTILKKEIERSGLSKTCPKTFEEVIAQAIIHLNI